MSTPLKKALARKFVIDQCRKKHQQPSPPQPQHHALTWSSTPPSPPL
jgi:hypothetical protein